MSETCFRIFHENYIDEDVLAAQTDKSSEQSAFPIENAYNQNRRSKVWRSNGYYEVTSSNNTIIFQETDGVNLTATIPTGKYTSAASLNIKTALEAAGASTYTVSFSSTTFKFTITSNGLGGGGLFKLMTTNASFTAEDLLGFDNSADKTGALTYTGDFIRIHTSEWVLWDLGVATNPDAFFLIDQRNASLQISPTATIKLQANETNNFASPSFEQSLTYDDETLAVLSENGIATTAYRYWRLLIEDKTNPNGYIQVGAFFLGNFLKWGRGRAQFALRQSFLDTSTTIFSEGGQTFSDLKEKTAMFGMQIKGLQKADIEEFETFFDDYGIGKPFFVSMDSGAVFSSLANRRIIFCKFNQQPNWTLESPDNFTIDMNLREEL